MNAGNAGGAPTCNSCGGLNVNPQSYQCRFCGQPLVQQPQHQQQPPMMGYGAPQAPYPPPVQNYGPNYGGPNYGGPPAQNMNPYGGPVPNPNPYAAYGGPHLNHNIVQPFGGVQTDPYARYVERRSFGSGWSTFFWVRLVFVIIAVGLSFLGACISAMSH